MSFALLLIMLLTPLAAAWQQPDLEEYLSELTLEVVRSDLARPNYIPLPRNLEIMPRSICSGAKPVPGEPFQCLEVAPEWISEDQLKVSLHRYRARPGTKRVDESSVEFGNQYWQTLILRQDQPIVLTLPGENGTVGFSLRKNVPNSPVPLRLTHHGATVSSIDIGEIIETRSHFVIEVINRSDRGIYGLAVTGSEGIVIRTSNTGPMLAPGEAQRKLCRRVPGGSFFFPAAVVFVDGNYEGAPDLAAQILSQRWGWVIQLERIAPVWEEAIEQSLTDPEGALNQLLRNIEDLETSADEDLEQEFFRSYPELGENKSSRSFGLPSSRNTDKIREKIARSLQSKKEALRKEVLGYRNEPEDLDLAEWLSLKLNLHRKSLTYLGAAFHR